MMIGANFINVIDCVESPFKILQDRFGFRKGDYEVRVKNGPKIELRPNRGDRDAFYEIWITKDYASHGEKIAPGDVVCDIGANIGCFSLYAANAAGPNGKVIACEPDPETFKQLERNISINGLEGVVFAEQCAVSNESGVLPLYRSKNSLFSSLFREVDGRSNGMVVGEVEVVTISQLFERHGVSKCDFLKLDCEGAEHAIIAALPPDIASILMRITAESHDIDDKQSSDLVDALLGHGFQQVEPTKNIDNSSLYSFRR